MMRKISLAGIANIPSITNTDRKVLRNMFTNRPHVEFIKPESFYVQVECTPISRSCEHEERLQQGHKHGHEQQRKRQRQEKGALNLRSAREQLCSDIEIGRRNGKRVFFKYACNMILHPEIYAPRPPRIIPEGRQDTTYMKVKRPNFVRYLKEQELRSENPGEQRTCELSPSDLADADAAAADDDDDGGGGGGGDGVETGDHLTRKKRRFFRSMNKRVADSRRRAKKAVEYFATLRKAEAACWISWRMLRRGSFQDTYQVKDEWRAE